MTLLLSILIGGPIIILLVAGLRAAPGDEPGPLGDPDEEPGDSGQNPA